MPVKTLTGMGNSHMKRLEEIVPDDCTRMELVPDITDTVKSS
jgi:hypothetical protein